ncbi:DUF898 family protein [Alistipes indistinctus]|jgi:uncharacterized membrane protein YjgN (DUF898 family)|uniref:DUF898 family protein n=1 Tax=Alistipes indistinctus TaxID=626932 RepID=UPI002430EC78|nr:DUF898 family protein [Alistipes indistinctus]
MKNYFNFRVRGLQLFAVCIGYLLCIVAGGYSGMTISMHYTQAAAMAAVDPVTSSAVAREALVELVVFQILYLLAACLLAFFYMRICIEGIEYRGEAVRTDYSFGRYLGLVALGTLLTFVTLGIYYPWFIARMTRFFSDNATYRDRPFHFKGAGWTLFCLMTFVLMIPYGILAFVLYFSSGVAAATGSAFFGILVPVCGVGILLLLALYYYLEFKWFIDFAYGEYRIRLKSPVLVALLFFFIQFTLSILTLGLYLPVALAMIYRFLVDNTVLLSGDGDEAGRFGYQGRFGYDCLYVFGQSMLVLLTAGIYLAWATARIGRRLASRTYLECPDTGGAVGSGTEGAEAIAPVVAPELR